MWLNCEEMDRLLADACPVGERYEAKAWGTLLGPQGRMLALGAGAGAYCYVGLTARTLVAVVVNPMDTASASGRMAIPLAGIQRVKVSGGLSPGRRLLRLWTPDHTLRLSLPCWGLGVQIPGQKQAVDTICNALKRRFAAPAGSQKARASA